MISNNCSKLEEQFFDMCDRMNDHHLPGKQAMIFVVCFGLQSGWTKGSHASSSVGPCDGDSLTRLTGRQRPMMEEPGLLEQVEIKARPGTVQAERK
jgi:hypothetical protein